MRHVAPLHDEEICRRIAEAREACGLTQTGLAQNLSAYTGATLTARDVRRYERSRVPWHLLDDLARITGTSRGWLLYGDAAGKPESLWERRAQTSGRGDAVEQTGVPARASRAPIVLGLALAFLLAVAVERLTSSLPAAFFALLVVVGIAWIREAHRTG